jgi:peptide/nickel transport system substrate-binding protein
MRLTPTKSAKTQRPLRGVISATVLAVVAALTISGCAPAQSDNTDGDGDTAASLNWALPESPRSLFAPTNYSTDGASIMSLVQGQLLNISPEGKLEPGVAAKWEAVDDTTYEYTLGDAVFSDGDKVTAEDVAFSLNLQLDPAVASQQAGLFDNVESATADGDIVTVKLKKPSSFWQFLPASIAGYVWQKKSVEASLDTYGTPETLPVGSGPYMVSKFVPDSQVVLERNPNYVGDKPKYDTITFKVIPDEQTRLLAMSSGEIDGTFAVPVAAVSQWEAAAEVSTFQGLRWRGLTLDMEQDPFSDIHVRKALYYATDRKAISDGLLGGLAELSSTVNDPTIFAGALDEGTVKESYGKIESFDFDLAKAREEMAMSSVPDGFAATLNVPEESDTIKSISEAVKANWAEIGVDLTLNLMPGGPRFQVIMDHGPDLGVQIIGNSPDVPDPTQMAGQYLSSTQAVQNGNNSSNLRDPDVDALIAKAQASTDPKESAEFTLEAQILASKQVPFIPLVWEKAPVAVKKGASATDIGPWFSQSVWTNLISLG